MQRTSGLVLIGAFILGLSFGSWFVTWMIQSGVGTCSHTTAVHAKRQAPLAINARGGAVAPNKVKIVADAATVRVTPISPAAPLSRAIAFELQERHRGNSQCSLRETTVVFGKDAAASHHRFCRGRLDRADRPEPGELFSGPGLVPALEAVATADREVLIISVPAGSMSKVSERNKLRACVASVARIGGAVTPLMIAFDDEAEQFITELAPGGTALFRMPKSERADLGASFVALSEALQLGFHVFHCDYHCVFARSPFELLWRDADVEAMSDGMEYWLAYGRGTWIDDPNMGWSRYAMNAQIAFVNPYAMYLRATSAALELVMRTAAEMRKAADGRDPVTLTTVVNMLIWRPFSGEYMSVKPQMRILDLSEYYSSLVLNAVHRNNRFEGLDRTALVSFATFHRSDADCAKRMMAASALLAGDRTAYNAFPVEPTPKVDK